MLVIVNPHHVVGIRGLKRFLEVKLFNQDDVLDVCVLTLFIFVYLAVVVGYDSITLKHPSVLVERQSLLISKSL